MIGLRQKIVSQALIYISIYLVVYGSYAAYIIIKKLKINKILIRRKFVFSALFSFFRKTLHIFKL